MQNVYKVNEHLLKGKSEQTTLPSLFIDHFLNETPFHKCVPSIYQMYA